MKPVLVVTHPRSGTHFLINAMALNLGFESRQIDVKDGWNGRITLDDTSHPEKVRKAHHQAPYMIAHPYFLDTFNVLYMVRDPRAVMLSCYEYFSKSPQIFPKAGSMDEFLKLNPSQWPFYASYNIIPSETMMENWNNHVISWLWLRDRLSIITYHELNNEFERTLHRVAAVIGKLPPVKPVRPSCKDHVVCPSYGEETRWKRALTRQQAQTIEQQTHPQCRQWLQN